MNHDRSTLTAFLHNLVRNYIKNIFLNGRDTLFSKDFAELDTLLISILRFFFAMFYFANQSFLHKISKIPLKKDPGQTDSK